jgi:hypothetical protein
MQTWDDDGHLLKFIDHCDNTWPVFWRCSSISINTLFVTSNSSLNLYPQKIPHFEALIFNSLFIIYDSHSVRSTIDCFVIQAGQWNLSEGRDDTKKRYCTKLQRKILSINFKNDMKEGSIAGHPFLSVWSLLYHEPDQNVVCRLEMLFTLYVTKEGRAKVFNECLSLDKINELHVSSTSQGRDNNLSKSKRLQIIPKFSYSRLLFRCGILSLLPQA